MRRIGFPLYRNTRFVSSRRASAVAPKNTTTGMLKDYQRPGLKQNCRSVGPLAMAHRDATP